MGTVRCAVTGGLAIGGVKRPGVVELDDAQVNVRALVRAGHVRVLPDPAPDGSAADGPAWFHPDGHTVDEVLAYLASVGTDEAARVIELEAAGKARKTILEA